MRRWWCRSEEHTSELQSHVNLVCRLLLEKKKQPRRRCLRASYTDVPRADRLRSCDAPRNREAARRRARRGRTRRPRSASPSFFFNDTATTEIYTLSLHDALPISFAAAPDDRELQGRPVESADRDE